MHVAAPGCTCVSARSVSHGPVSRPRRAEARADVLDTLSMGSIGPSEPRGARAGPRERCETLGEHAEDAQRAMRAPPVEPRMARAYDRAQGPSGGPSSR